MPLSNTAVPLDTPKERSGLSVKELALYVGVPVATVCVAGGLYYYFSKSKTSTPQQKAATENDNTTPLSSTEATANEDSNENTVHISYNIYYIKSQCTIVPNLFVKKTKSGMKNLFVNFDNSQI